MTNPAATDFNSPVPRGAVRISVQYGEGVYVGDFPVAAIMTTVANMDALAKRVMDLGGERLSPEHVGALASVGANSENASLVILAGLWLFLREPGQVRDGAAEMLVDLLNRDGAALIKCNVDATGSKWTFSLLSANQNAIDAAAALDNPSGTVH